MTSGLENPLTYLLVSLLFYCLFCFDKEKKIKLIFLILSLIVLNRFDYGLLFLPLALVLMYTFINRKNCVSVLWIGVSLLLLWFIFSTIYFGSLFPNTYYAKLNADYPVDEVITRGIYYYKALYNLDLNSVVILVLGFLSLLLYRDKFTIAIMVGKILYCIYILRAGGDFMQGRFFSVLVLISVGELIVAISRSKMSVKYKNFLVLSQIVLLIYLSIWFSAPIYSTTNYLPRQGYNGIVDERGLYYKHTGLLASNRIDWLKITYLDKQLLENYRFFCGAIGKISLLNDSVVLIDLCGLADPYLSRLPAIRTPYWRIGHHMRKLPTEFGQFRTRKLREIPDQNLKDLFNDISIVVNGDIFTVPRFMAIWRLLTNSYSSKDFSKYSDSEVYIPLTSIVEHSKVTDWNSDIFYGNFNGNLKVEANIPKRTSVVWFKADWAHSYDLIVNDKKIYTLLKDRKYCEKGIKLYLPTEQLVKNIQFIETDVTKFTHDGFNYLVFLRLRENKENEANFESHCIIRIQE